jgi:hypothetical protein
VFFFGESIGRKRMILSGAATMLVGTVRETSDIKLDFNLCLVGDFNEQHDYRAIVCWADCNGTHRAAYPYYI